jgi:putative modified peptide
MPGTRMTPELIDKLLDKLSSDDQFRADFQKDPDAAMSQLGAQTNNRCKDGVPFRLASKEQIQKTRDHLKEELLGLDAMAPECLELIT